EDPTLWKRLTADGPFRASHPPARSAQSRPAGPPPSPLQSCDRSVSAPHIHQATAAVPPTLPASASRSPARSLQPFFRSFATPAKNSSHHSKIITLSGLASAPSATYRLQPARTQTPFSTTKFPRIPNPLINLHSMRTPFESL